MQLTLAQKFERILEIKTQIEGLVTEANLLLQNGGSLLIEELHQQFLLPPAERATQKEAIYKPSTTSEPPTNLVPLPFPTPTPVQDSVGLRSTTPSASPATAGTDEPQPYSPKPRGPLKGKTLAEAVETVMRDNFSQVPGANRQILAVLGDKGFDGFAPHSQDTPMELLRRALLSNPNIERPNRKAYIWKPRDLSPAPAPTQNAPDHADPSIKDSPDNQPQPVEEATQNSETDLNQPDSNERAPSEQALTLSEMLLADPGADNDDETL